MKLTTIFQFKSFLLMISVILFSCSNDETIEDIELTEVSPGEETAYFTFELINESTVAGSLSNGRTLAAEDDYYSGDWNGDGKDNIAVRRGNQILIDNNFDSWDDGVWTAVVPSGDIALDYHIGDFNGNGVDDFAVRYKHLNSNLTISYFLTTNYGQTWNVTGQSLGGVVWSRLQSSSVGDKPTYGSSTITYKRGWPSNSNTTYYAFTSPTSERLFGDWDGDGIDEPANRNGYLVYMESTPNLSTPWYRVQGYGLGNSEDQYLVGDWDGDGKSNLAIRRGNKIYMDTNFDGSHDILQVYGNGTN